MASAPKPSDKERFYVFELIPHFEKGEPARFEVFVKERRNVERFVEKISGKPLRTGPQNILLTNKTIRAITENLPAQDFEMASTKRGFKIGNVNCNFNEKERLIVLSFTGAALPNQYVSIGGTRALIFSGIYRFLEKHMHGKEKYRGYVVSGPEAYTRMVGVRERFDAEKKKLIEWVERHRDPAYKPGGAKHPTSRAHSRPAGR